MRVRHTQAVLRALLDHLPSLFPEIVISPPRGAQRAGGREGTPSGSRKSSRGSGRAESGGASAQAASVKLEGEGAAGRRQEKGVESAAMSSASEGDTAGLPQGAAARMEAGQEGVEEASAAEGVPGLDLETQGGQKEVAAAGGPPGEVARSLSRLRDVFLEDAVFTNPLLCYRGTHRQGPSPQRTRLLQRLLVHCPTLPWSARDRS